MSLIYPTTFVPSVSHITPFTVRDGATYLELLEAIRAYVIQLGLDLNEEIALYHSDPRYQRIVVTGVTTSAGATFLKQDDGTSVVIPDSTTQSFLINLVARRADGTTNESAGYFIQGVIERGDSAASTVMVGSYGVTAIEDQASWAVDVTANASTGALDIAVLGENGKTISWVAAVQMTSVTV